MISIAILGFITALRTAQEVVAILADVIRGRWQSSGRAGLASTPEDLADLDRVVIVRDEQERV